MDSLPETDEIEPQDEEVAKEIDDRYTTPLLTPQQRKDLVAWVNGPNEQSEDEDEIKDASSTS